MTALSVSAYPLVMTQFLQWPRIKIIQRNDFLPVTHGTLLVLCVMDGVTENGNFKRVGTLCLCLYGKYLFSLKFRS